MSHQVTCSRCKHVNANVKRSKTNDNLCIECFYYCFETEIHDTIVRGQLYKSGDTVAIAASGGKDSTVLAYVLKKLNEQYNYGLNLFLLSIDEGITGYRDDSLNTVKQNQIDYQLPLKILNYKDLYGWTMDEIVQKIGIKNNCTFCGVFRRQALDRGAIMLGCDSIATGHNADDLAETILMNVLRGDISRLKRSTRIVTDIGEEFETATSCIRRTKPFKYAYEKEIVLYARFKKLKYFSTECIYSPMAYRGFVREHLKHMEKICPSVILDIIHSGEYFDEKKANEKVNDVTKQSRGICKRCSYISSMGICKACMLLEELNDGKPILEIGE